MYILIWFKSWQSLEWNKDLLLEMVPYFDLEKFDATLRLRSKYKISPVDI